MDRGRVRFEFGRLIARRRDGFLLSAKCLSHVAVESALRLPAPVGCEAVHRTRPLFFVLSHLAEFALHELPARFQFRNAPSSLETSGRVSSSPLARVSAIVARICPR